MKPNVNVSRDWKEREVVVVGGSAAGFFTAHLLAKANKGLKVRVLEAEEHLDPVPRTLIVTSRMRDLLGQVGDQSLVNYIRHFELFADAQMATIALQLPDLIIERSKLIKALAAQAELSGAQILFGRRFINLESAGKGSKGSKGSKGKGLRLTVERSAGGGTEQIAADIVIGADGAFSKVARSAGWPAQATVPLLQAIVTLPENLRSDTTQVWFAPEDTPYFYWLIPESDTHGALGLIGEEGKKTRLCLERFLEQHGLEPLEFQGARIPLYTHWIPLHKRVGNGHVYLVGDAAGHVKVSTVGGIVTGLKGALGVAESILNGGSSPNLRALRRELDRHLMIRKILHHFTPSDYSQLLELLNGPVRNLLSHRTRDDTAKLLLGLIIGQPRLLLLSLRRLLTAGHFPPGNWKQEPQEPQEPREQEATISN